MLPLRPAEIKPGIADERFSNSFGFISHIQLGMRNKKKKKWCVIGLTLYPLYPKQAKPAFLLLAEPEINSLRLQVGQGDASAEQSPVVSHEVSGTFIKTLARDGCGGGWGGGIKRIFLEQTS